MAETKQAEVETMPLDLSTASPEELSKIKAQLRLENRRRSQRQAPASHVRLITKTIDKHVESIVQAAKKLQDFEANGYVVEWNPVLERLEQVSSAHLYDTAKGAARRALKRKHSSRRKSK